MSRVFGITKTRLNMREGAGTQHSIIEVLDKGTRMRVVEDLGTWLNVQVGDRVGFVHENYVVIEIVEDDPANPPLDPAKSKKGVTTARVNLRKGPGTEYPIVETLPPDLTVDILEDLGKWLSVFVGGEQGFLHEDFVKIQEGGTAGNGSDEETPIDLSNAVKAVTITNVNLRKGPGTEFDLLATLPPGTEVHVLEDLGKWLNIAHDQQIAYLHEDLVKLENEGDSGETLNEEREKLFGQTIAGLNMRQGPGTEFEVLLVIPNGARIEILEDLGKWLDVIYQDQRGFVHEDYVRLESDSETEDETGGETPLDTERQYGRSKSRLNMRDAPSLNGQILRTLDSNTLFEITSRIGQWLGIRLLTGQRGFVHGNYVTLVSSETGLDAGTGTGGTGIVVSDPGAGEALGLPPEEHLPVNSDAPWLEQLVADAWNRYGGLLQRLSPGLGIDPAVSVAVLAIESGARGFGPDGRMIIRFENHIFWDFWGEGNKKVFDRHFQFNANARWMGHQFRTTRDGSWITQHVRSQRIEWQAYNFAASLNRTAARMSISMGGPQIMGFNYRRIGYDSVHQMFDDFQSSERNQIIGFFNFIKGTSARIEALQNKDFVTFARYYNGSGQAEKYGGLIQNVFDTFNRLRAS